MWRNPWTIQSTSFRKLISKQLLSQLILIRSISCWLLSPLTTVRKYISQWLLSEISTFWESNNHMTSQMIGGDPSVITRMSALCSKIWQTTNLFQLTAWGCPLNLCVSLPPVFSRTAHQKQVISELSNAPPIMTSSTTASSMNGFLCLMTQTTHVRSSARPKEQPWLLNYPPRS